MREPQPEKISDAKGNAAMIHPHNLFQKTIAVFISASLIAQSMPAQGVERSFWMDRAQASRLRQESSERGNAAFENLRRGFRPMEPDGAAAVLGRLGAEGMSEEEGARLSEASAAWWGYGTLREVRRPEVAGDGGPLVVLIQDAHGLPSAQKNIAAIILGLAERRPRLVVGLEGAAGEIDATAFRGPSAKVNREVATFLVGVDLISGPELAALSAPPSVRFSGLEDPVLYRRHVRVVQSIVPRKALTAAAMSRWAARVDALKKKMWPDLLVELDRRIGARESGGSPLSDHMSFLAAASPGGVPHDLQQVSLFFDILRLEKSLDLQALERQKADVLKRLSFEEMGAIAQASLSLKANRLRPSAYFRLFREAARRGAPRSPRLSSIDQYVDYLTRMESVQPQDFEAQLKSWERLIARTLCASPAQRRLLEVSEDTALLRRLTELSMNPSDWTEYASRRSEILALSGRVAALDGTTDGAAEAPPLEDFESFYRLAQGRNDSLSRHMMESLPDSGGWGAAVLGGFHTDGFASLLTRRGAWVAVVEPRMDQADLEAGADALAVFTRARTDVESLFLGPRASLVASPALAPLTAEARRRAEVARPLAERLHALMPGLEGMKGEPAPSIPSRDRLEKTSDEEGMWAAAVVTPAEGERRPYGVVVTEPGVSPDVLPSGRMEALRGKTLLTGKTEGGRTVLVVEKSPAPLRSLISGVRWASGRVRLGVCRAARRSGAFMLAGSALFPLALFLLPREPRRFLVSAASNVSPAMFMGLGFLIGVVGFYALAVRTASSRAVRAETTLPPPQDGGPLQAWREILTKPDPLASLDLEAMMSAARAAAERHGITSQSLKDPDSHRSAARVFAELALVTLRRLPPGSDSAASFFRAAASHALDLRRAYTDASNVKTYRGGYGWAEGSWREGLWRAFRRLNGMQAELDLLERTLSLRVRLAARSARRIGVTTPQLDPSSQARAVFASASAPKEEGGAAAANMDRKILGRFCSLIRGTVLPIAVFSLLNVGTAPSAVLGAAAGLFHFVFLQRFFIRRGRGDLAYERGRRELRARRPSMAAAAAAEGGRGRVFSAGWLRRLVWIGGVSGLALAMGGVLSGGTTMCLMALPPALARAFPNHPRVHRWVPLAVRAGIIAAGGFAPSSIAAFGAVLAAAALIQRFLPRRGWAYQLARIGIPSSLALTIGLAGAAWGHTLMDGGAGWRVEAGDTLGGMVLRDLRELGIEPTSDAVMERLAAYQRLNPEIQDVHRIMPGQTFHRPGFGEEIPAPPGTTPAEEPQASPAAPAAPTESTAAPAEKPWNIGPWDIPLLVAWVQIAGSLLTPRIGRRLPPGNGFSARLKSFLSRRPMERGTRRSALDPKLEAFLSMSGLPVPAAVHLSPAAGNGPVLAAVDISSMGTDSVEFLAERLGELRGVEGRVLLPLVTWKPSLAVGSLKARIETALLSGSVGDPWSVAEVQAMFQRTGFGKLVVTGEDLSAAGQRGDPADRIDTQVLCRLLRDRSVPFLGAPGGGVQVRLFTDDPERYTASTAEAFKMLFIRSMKEVVEVTESVDRALKGFRRTGHSA